MKLSSRSPNDSALPLVATGLTTKLGLAQQWRRRRAALISLLGLGLWSGLATLATGLNPGGVQSLERQLQTIFFDVRGPVAPPPEIIILAIDDTSLDYGRNFGPPTLQTWPWARVTYAEVMTRLFEAGAIAVGVDIWFSTPSLYGPADDAALATALAEYGDRVVLASRFYTDNPTTSTAGDTPQSIGELRGLESPLPEFRATARTGLVNMPQAANGRIHSLGHTLLEAGPDQSLPFEDWILADDGPNPWVPFAEAVLQTAQIDYAPPATDIFFYGPSSTFTTVSLWQVLDPAAWQANLGNGELFRDKIVLIGGTSGSLQDRYLTPFGRHWPEQDWLPGVEIQANAIATLLQDRSIGPLFSSPLFASLWVAGVMGGVAIWLYRCPRPLGQVGRAGVAIAVLNIGGYLSFTYSQSTLPIAVPSLAIGLAALTQTTLSAVQEQLRRKQWRQTLKQYASLPIVQEIISQQEDLQDLLLEREAEIFGKLLGQRYRVVKVLGTGGFGETYIAEDTQRPSNPACVVKRLRLLSDKPDMLKLMRRLFLVEAETLERLGQHSQIPQLLAYFEEDQEFYLVQELIIGRSLHSELVLRGVLPVASVLSLLVDLLSVLDFVHHQNVIHRDIKPVNIIRRTADSKLVLIDFGIAKRLSSQMADAADPETKFTVGLGTRGYMPSEQAAGMPQFSSDIYALGMTAIEALTGLSPAHLPKTETGALNWQSLTPHLSPEFKALLSRMVHYDYLQRYDSAAAVLADLKQVPEASEAGMGDQLEQVGQPNLQKLIENSDLELAEASADTHIWDVRTDPTYDAPAGDRDSTPR